MARSKCAGAYARGKYSRRGNVLVQPMGEVYIPAKTEPERRGGRVGEMHTPGNHMLKKTNVTGRKNTGQATPSTSKKGIRRKDSRRMFTQRNSVLEGRQIVALSERRNDNLVVKGSFKNVAVHQQRGLKTQVLEASVVKKNGG